MSRTFFIFMAYGLYHSHYTGAFWDLNARDPKTLSRFEPKPAWCVQGPEP